MTLRDALEPILRWRIALVEQDAAFRAAGERGESIALPTPPEPTPKQWAELVEAAR